MNNLKITDYALEYLEKLVENDEQLVFTKIELFNDGELQHTITDLIVVIGGVVVEVLGRVFGHDLTNDIEVNELKLYAKVGSDEFVFGEASQNKVQTLVEKNTLNTLEFKLNTTINKTSMVNVLINGAYVGDQVKVLGQSKPAELNPNYKIVGRFDEYYHSPELEDLQEELTDSDIFFIYNRYNYLSNTYQSIMKKNLLGYGSSSTGKPDKSLPIYEYVISPPETPQLSQGGTSTELDPAPLILLTTGVHGNEKSAVYSCYEFIRQMLEGNKLDALLANFQFKIIPIVNPGGYSANSRNNLNGVNINRNFNYEWDAFTSGEKGEQPLSEPESQIVSRWLEENKHAVAYIDHHNFIRSYPGRDRRMTSYHLTPNDELSCMYSSLMRLLSLKWNKKYLQDYNPAGDIAYGFSLNDFYHNCPGVINDAYYLHKINLSVTPEAASEDPFDISLYHTKTSLELNVELLVNYILAMVDTCMKNRQNH